MKILSTLSLFAALFANSFSATFYWTAGGDGASIYQEANWTAAADGSGANIPVINANTAVNHDLIVNSGTPGGGGGGSASLDLGSGSLTVNAGTFRMNVGQSAAILNADVSMNSGLLIVSSLRDGAVALNGGTVELHNGGDPLDNVTVDFSAASQGSLIFKNETVAEVNSEHLSKLTVAGAPAVSSGAGQNVVVSTSANGVVLMLGSQNSADSDDDQDGLSNAEEASLNTNPLLRDTDGDGTPDGLEVEKGLNPLDNSDGLERPNIIFFFVDDLGYGDLGCFWQDAKTGTQKFDTPGIDSMAATGAKLTHHYISAPVCAPSRASLLQGRHQGHADVRDSQFDRALVNNHSMADTLRRAGYRTIHVGKNGLAGGEGSTSLVGNGSQNLGAHPLSRGWDEFFGYLFHGDGHEHFPRNGSTDKTAHIYDGYRQVKDASSDLYTTDAWTAYAKKAIIEEANDGDGQPFFLYLAYDSPHFKMQRPSVAYPPNLGLNGGVQWTTATDGSGNVRYASTATGTGVVDGFDHPDNNASWPLQNRQHVGMIRRIDNSVADIIELLKDLNLDDNTLCVFTSDNGPHNEQHNPRYFESFANLEGIKRDMLEGGIRVPAVVRWPGNIAGTTNDENAPHEISYPTSIWDWMPTFADLAEVPAPSWCDGVSLVPTLTGTGTQREKGYLYFEFNNSGSTPNWVEFPNNQGASRGQMQCVRIDDFMGIRTSIANANTDFRIYNSVTDPGQGTDLAAAMPELQDEMKKIALRSRRPGTVSRPYDSANVPAILGSTEPGLEVASYEGIWTYLPEFRDLTEVSSEMVTFLDLSKRSRDENVGLYFSGMIDVPVAGTYNFFVESDSGANFFLHDAHLIDDDFNHTGVERSASINLEAGPHPFRLYYRHGVSGNHLLNLSWSGPGLAKEAVPSSAFVRAIPPVPEPVLQDDQASTTGSSVDIPVLANDTDDGSPAALSIASVGSPANGTAVIVGTQIRYTPTSGFYGTDQFLYTATDGQFLVQASVTVSVNYQAADLWIPLDECHGAEINEAGGSLLGTMTGFADVDAARVVGVDGNALFFDGIDDQVTLTGVLDSNLPSGDSPRTIMAWVKTINAQENATIFGYGVNANGQRFTFRTNGSAGSPTSQPLRLEVQGGFIVGTTNLNNGQWHHVAAVCDDFDNSGTMDVNETKLYVDGVEEVISNSGSRVIVTAPMTTAVLGGSNHAAGYNFAGEIDSLRLFPAAFSGAQISTMMNESHLAAVAWHRENFGPALVDWAPDDDGDGLTRLAEYAFGKNPYLRDSVSPVQAGYDRASAKLVMTFPRLISGNHGLLYEAQASPDLQDWSTLTVSETGTAPHALEECLEMVSVETDADSLAEVTQFIRVKVELAP